MRPDELEKYADHLDALVRLGEEIRAALPTDDEPSVSIRDAFTQWHDSVRVVPLSKLLLSSVDAVDAEDRVGRHLTLNETNLRIVSMHLRKAASAVRLLAEVLRLKTTVAELDEAHLGALAQTLVRAGTKPERLVMRLADALLPGALDALFGVSLPTAASTIYGAAKAVPGDGRD